MPTISHHTAKTATEIDLADFTFADPLAIAFMALRLRAGHLQFTQRVGQCSTFLSRVGVYRYAQVDDPHRIHARRDADRTIEIQNADLSQDVVFDRLRGLLRADASLSTIEQVVIEMMSNVENHSGSEGVVVGQVVRQKIQLAIVDPGVGIHRSLRTAAQYAHLTEPEAIVKSLEKGVTNGRGMGIGLWSASTVIRANGGELLVGSGNYEFSTTSGRVRPAAAWLGTYVKLTYDLTRPVDYHHVTGHGRGAEPDAYDLPF